MTRTLVHSLIFAVILQVTYHFFGSIFEGLDDKSKDGSDKKSDNKDKIANKGGEAAKDDNKTRQDNGTKRDNKTRQDNGTKRDAGAKDDNKTRQDTGAKDDNKTRQDNGTKRDTGAKDDNKTRQDNKTKDDNKTRQDNGEKRDNKTRQDNKTKDDKGAKQDNGTTKPFAPNSVTSSTTLQASKFTPSPTATNAAKTTPVSITTAAPTTMMLTPAPTTMMLTPAPTTRTGNVKKAAVAAITRAPTTMATTTTSKNTVHSYPPKPLNTATYVTNINNSSYGNGTYIVSASVERGGPGTSANAFSGTGSYSSVSDFWQINPFPTNTTTLVSGKNIIGEWLQLQLPYAITITKYSTFFGSINVVGQWIIAGSNDGNNWTLLDSQNPNGSGFNKSMYFNTLSFNINSTNAYNYYRFIFMNTYIYNPDGTSIPSSQPTYGVINNLIYYGTP